jgi:hypothetical protein
MALRVCIRYTSPSSSKIFINPSISAALDTFYNHCIIFARRLQPLPILTVSLQTLLFVAFVISADLHRERAQSS